MVLFDEEVFRKVDLNALVTFFVIYRERSVTRAARAMHVTQPAVSNSLNRLRTKFGDPLFVLYGRNLEPTDKATEIASVLEPVLVKMQRLIVQSVSTGKVSDLPIVRFKSFGV